MSKLKRWWYKKKYKLKQWWKYKKNIIEPGDFVYAYKMPKNRSVTPLGMVIKAQSANHKWYYPRDIGKRKDIFSSQDTLYIYQYLWAKDYKLITGEAKDRAEFLEISGAFKPFFINDKYKEKWESTHLL